MALWTFHNNPGIGGFGENNPVLFDGARVLNESKRSRKLEKKKDPPTSANFKNETTDGTTGTTNMILNDRTNVHITTNGSSTGDGDVICQIVKELVDNAVDACRSPAFERQQSQNGSRKRSSKRRIRVDIRPPAKDNVDVSTLANGQKEQREDVLQVTVTDTGCGMENIQNCVNAFHSSKDGSKVPQNSRNHTSGRYGIGLTLCLLHAQRCVPNSRACISSATLKSKLRTRALFEVDKEEDAVKCVQEEVMSSSTSGQESGTCVSLLVPGGEASKLAWPRLHDYFTRFRLCTKLHFELDVFAPTLCRLPIYIRPRQGVGYKLGNSTATDKKNSPIKTKQKFPDSDEWQDLLEDDEGQEKTFNDLDSVIDKKQKSNGSSDTNMGRKTNPQRQEFFDVVRSFWPSRTIVYNNVACSLQKIRNYNYPRKSKRKETKGKPEIHLEVNMAVCPHLDCEKEDVSSLNSAATTSNKALSGKGEMATLQLVRMINGVPIMESAEAHSCGIVHGIANKSIWGSFGLDIDRSTEKISPCANSSTPSFHLRDSSLIAPFINRKRNHKELKKDDYDNIHKYNHETKKKRNRDVLVEKDLLPANIRIGTILVVVQIHATPSSLPLPTLSKGRLPFNHQPIDSALQLGLRDCLSSLQSSNPVLFLTTSQLRSVERDVRYIPGIASAVSRIVCRSKNRSLRRKSLELFYKTSTGNDALKKEFKGMTPNLMFESLSTLAQREHERGEKNLDVALLANALESQLRLAIKIRNEVMKKKRCKKQRVHPAKEEEYDEFDSGNEKEKEVKSLQASIRNESTVSFFSSASQSVHRSSAKDCFGDCLEEDSIIPLKEIVVDTRSTLSTNEGEDDFDDWW